MSKDTVQSEDNYLVFDPLFQNNHDQEIEFPLAPMGVLATVSAHARHSARPPIDTSRNVPAHMSADSPSNISPNPSEVISEVSEP